MKFIIYSIIILFLIFNTACSKRDNRISNNVIVKLQDSIKLNNFFISKKKAEVFVRNKYLYFSNQELNQINSLNIKTKKITTFGNKGKGPGEFNSITSIYYDNKNDNICIYDAQLRRITYFDKNNKLIKIEKIDKLFKSDYIKSHILDITKIHNKYYLMGKKLFLKNKEMIDTITEIDANKHAKFIVRRNRKVEANNNLGLVEFAIRNFLRFDFNTNTLFILDNADKNFSVLSYNIDTGKKDEIAINQNSLQTENYKYVRKIFAGSDFFILEIIAPDDLKIYEFYNLSGKFLKKLVMENELSFIGEVNNDSLYVFEYNEKVDIHYCNIYKLGN